MADEDHVAHRLGAHRADQRAVGLVAPGRAPAAISAWSGERTYAVIGLTVADEEIVAIDILADPARLEQLALA